MKVAGETWQRSWRILPAVSSYIQPWIIIIKSPKSLRFLFISKGYLNLPYLWGLQWPCPHDWGLKMWQNQTPLIFQCLAHILLSLKTKRKKTHFTQQKKWKGPMKKVIQTASFQPFTQIIVQHSLNNNWAEDQVWKVLFTPHQLGTRHFFFKPWNNFHHFVMKFWLLKKW